MKAKHNISKKRNPFNCIVIILTTLYIISITSISLQAQQPISNDFSRTGECLSYTIYYKWGALMPRAGDASLSFEKQDRGFRSRLLFRTAPFFDAIFSMETFARRLACILFVNSLYNRELFCIFEH